MLLNEIPLRYPISKKSSSPSPLGCLLLYLRGAIQNLREAVSSKDGELILTRRKQLAEILMTVEVNIYKQAFNRSPTFPRLIVSLEEAKQIGILMLNDASSHLSESLVLVPLL